MKKITVQDIAKKAKEIYKKHPDRKWITCIKEASKMLKDKQ
jgi:hypothetical protein